MKRRRADRMLHGTAIHEAGHAVAALYLGHRLRRVTIIPRGDALGVTTHTPLKFGALGLFDDSPRGIARAERRIVILYAGPIAERKVAPRSHWRLGGASDFEGAHNLLSRIAGEHDRQHYRLYSELLWRRAELLVNLRWKDIKAVAAELLRVRALDAAGLRAVIDRVYGRRLL